MNELRRDPISGRWTIVEYKKHVDFRTLLGSGKRKRRPQDPHTCPFCGGNESMTPPEVFALRKPGAPPNSPGWQVRVVPDRDPVLQPRGPLNNHGYGLYDVFNGVGVHEILIEHPEHFANIQDFSIEHMQRVLEVMQLRTVELKKDLRFRYVLIHKNYGEAMGTTLEHAYSHILASPITPPLVRVELSNAKDYYEFKERCIYCDVVQLELEKRERIIYEDGHFLAIAPFASQRPFEIWILPERHETFFEQNQNLAYLAEIMIRIMGKIHRLLKDPDYIITFHNGPNTAVSHQRGYWKTITKDFHWHIEIVPTLHSFTSFELGSGFAINPVPPELATKILTEEKLPV